MTTKAGEWKNGIWVPTQPIEVKRKKTIKTEVMPRKLSELQKYQKAQDMYMENHKIKKKVRDLMTKYRSNAQKIGQLLLKE